MTSQLVFTHLKGANQNKIEHLPLDGLTEVSIGRDPSSAIVIDGRDDLVGRHHAVVKIQHNADGKTEFQLLDLSSQNGTFLNGHRLSTESELLPGDKIELALGGPQLGFDLYPPLPKLTPRTRVMSSSTASMTRVAPTTAQPKNEPETTIEKRGVGKETVERLLTDQRRSQSRIWMYTAAGILAAVAVTGGVLYYYNNSALSKIKTSIGGQIGGMATTVTGMSAKIGLTPEDIATQYAKATVKIYVNWGLYDSDTGKPLFQKTVALADGRKFPIYIKLAPNGNSQPGKVVRWLTTDDNNDTNIPIGIPIDEIATASGFVVDSRGFILTNKHVAAGWMLPDSDGIAPHSGLVIDQATGKVTELDDSGAADLASWVPAKGGYVFDAKMPRQISDETAFEGRNLKLEVRFPDTSVSYPAQLIQASNVADVSEIKIDAMRSLPTVPLARGNDVELGENVTVLGYPGVSVQNFAVQWSIENGDPSTAKEDVPTPTVTSGQLSAISKGEQRGPGGTTVLGRMGEVYQLSINTTGAGNSGGPVFDTRGNVIGIFTYSATDNEGTHVSLAVPVHFGRELLDPSAAN